MDDDAGLVTILGEAAHLVGGHAFLDAREGFVIARFVADEEEAEAVVLETLDRIVIEVRAAVAAPVNAERAELLRDFACAREVRGEGVVIEEKFPDLREYLLHVGHLVGDVLRTADAILVSADGLRPKAERALRRAAASRVHAHVGMQQVADEVVLDLEVALVHVGDPRERVHVLDHLALLVVDDLAVGVAEGESVDGFNRAILGDFLAGEIELLAPDPVDGRRGFQCLGGQHRGVRADETDLRIRTLRLDGLGDLAVILQRGRAGVDDDVIVVLRDVEAFILADVVRRTIEELRAGDQGGGLREPGRIPIRSNFAPRLVARTGTTIKAIERGRRKEQSLAH